MAQNSSPAAAPADRVIVQKRMFDAPRELVFEMWMDPSHIAQWWGPDGFTTTVQEMEVRPGGTWRFIMHGPDGTDYDNRVVYIEVTSPSRLVFHHGSDVDDDPNQFHVTVTFEERDGQTELTMISTFKTAEERNRVVEFGAIELGKQTLNHLAEYLATIQR